MHTIILKTYNVISTIFGLFTEWGVQLGYRLRHNKKDFEIMQKIEITSTDSVVVLYISGWLGRYINFKKMDDSLRLDGVQTTIANYKEPGLSVKDVAKLNVDYILSNNFRNLVIVGHSKGGTVGKYILDNYPEINLRVKKLITVSTPWSGIFWGRFKIKHMDEFGYGSLLLSELSTNKDNFSKLSCVRACVDDAVLPNSALYLEGVESTTVDVVGHGRALEHAATIDTVRQSIDK